MKITKAQENALDSLCLNYLEDITYYVEDFDGDEAEFSDYIQERIKEEEVIYYKNAIDFLTEEDQSLMESLEIAKDFGYSIDNINSELLATILKQERMLEEFGENEKAIIEIIF